MELRKLLVPSRRAQEIGSKEYRLRDPVPGAGAWLLWRLGLEKRAVAVSVVCVVGADDGERRRCANEPTNIGGGVSRGRKSIVSRPLPTRCEASREKNKGGGHKVINGSGLPPRPYGW